MSDADMIIAIINALQTDSNILLLIRAAATRALNSGTIGTDQLNNLMTALGLNTGG